MYDPTAWRHPVLPVNNGSTVEFVLYPLHCHRPVICESLHSEAVLGVGSSVRASAGRGTGASGNAVSPLTNQHGFLKVDAVCSMIITCGVLMLAGLAQRTVFRCAIEMGMAGCFPETDLYGPALAKVHHLESKVADYPRIVIGPMLIEYLEAHRQSQEGDPLSRFNRWLSDLSLRLLTQDTDGQWMVDYLGRSFRALSIKSESLGQVGESASDFVMGELDRFRKEKDEKLIGKYERLMAYFRSREST